MEQKKVVYISGPITGVENYWEPFEKAETLLEELGYIPLTPTRLPKGMTNEQYMRINFAMIDSADAVVFLPDWEKSHSAQIEKKYCHYIGKPKIAMKVGDRFNGLFPDSVTRAWLKNDLRGVLGQ